MPDPHRHSTKQIFSKPRIVNCHQHSHHFSSFARNGLDAPAPAHDICSVFLRNRLSMGHPFRPGQVLSHGVASIEQASSGMQFTIAHERRSSSRCRGSRCRQQRNLRSWILTVQECTVFVRLTENNKHSPRILHGSERCGNCVGSLYGMVVVQAAVQMASGECTT